MSITPQDLLDIAESIYANGGEISHRSATNRAYYSSFHLCSEFADSYPLPEPPYAQNVTGSHDRLAKKFSTYSEEKNKTTINSIGYILLAFKSLRSEADYGISNDFPESKSKEAIVFSKRLRDKVSSCLSSNVEKED